MTDITASGTTAPASAAPATPASDISDAGLSDPGTSDPTVPGLPGGDGGDALVTAFNAVGADYLFCSSGSEWAPVWESLARRHRDGLPCPRDLDLTPQTVAVGMATRHGPVQRPPHGVPPHPAPRPPHGP